MRGVGVSRALLPALVAGLAVCAALGATSFGLAASPAPRVVVVDLRGTLDSVTSGLAGTGVADAAGPGVEALMVVVDSPGGRPEAASEIVAAMRRSPVPVVAVVLAGGRADGTAAELLGGADLRVTGPAGGPGTYRDPDAVDRALDGRTVVHAGHATTLHTAGAVLTIVSASGGDAFRQGLATPDAAFLLLVLGLAAAGLFAVHPGNPLPLLVAAVAGAGVVVAVTSLPVAFSGALLPGVAVVLFLADLFVPSHGVMTAAGIGALLWGGSTLVDGRVYAGGVSPLLLGGCAVVVAGAYALILPRLIAVRRLPVLEPMEELVGRIATVREPLRPEGMVALGTTCWRARTSGRGVAAGRRVRIVGSTGLRLEVEPLEPARSRAAASSPAEKAPNA